MKTFTLGVSYCAYPTKPTDDDIKNIFFTNRTVNVYELTDIIQSGHSCCHQFSRDNFTMSYKTIKNFTEASFIVLDFDHSPLSYQDAIKNVLIKPSVSFETFSNKPDDNRFKLIYVIDTPISSITEYKRFTEMVFSIIFNEPDRVTITDSLDNTCYGVHQMFHGTNNSKQIDNSDTVISVDLINQLNNNDFNSYEEVFYYLAIPIDFKPKPRKKWNHKKNTNQETKTKISKKCPKTQKTRKKVYEQQDFTTIPNCGTLDDLFDIGINNEVFFIPSKYNNYHTIHVADVQEKKVYFYVGNQNIYAANTYFKDGKQKKGYRRNTLKYTAQVLRNLYPDATENEMFLNLRSYVYNYFELPGELNNDWIRRLAASTIAQTEKNDAGKKYFVLNPAYNYLTKSEKMKEFHKVKSEMMTSYVLNKYDDNLTMKENGELILLHPKTIKKYLDKEGFVYSNIKGNSSYQQFIYVYSIEGNNELSVRRLAELCGISKSQIARFRNQYDKK